MLLPIDMKFAARKVHFLQNEGPEFEPVGNFTVPLPCVCWAFRKIPCSPSFETPHLGSWTHFLQRALPSAACKFTKCLFC